MGRIEGQWVIHRVSSFQIWIEKSLKWDGVRPQGTVARNTVRCTTVGHKSWYISLAAFDIWQGRKKYCFQLCNFEKNLKKIKKAKMPELDDAFPCTLLNRDEILSFLPLIVLLFYIWKAWQCLKSQHIPGKLFVVGCFGSSLLALIL